MTNAMKKVVISMMRGGGHGQGRYGDVYGGSVQNPRQEHCAINLLDSEYIIDINVAEAVNYVNEFFSELFEVALDSGAGEHVANNKDAPN